MRAELQDEINYSNSVVVEFLNLYQLSISMPGISLIKDKFLSQKKDEIRNSLDSINYLPSFSSEVLFNNDSLFIGSNKFDEYPINTFTYRNYIIFIEGKIYNKSEPELKSEIFDFINNLGKKNFESTLKDWILSADGDYIIFIINRDNNDLIVFNDIFGRLPLYYHQSETGVVVSRYLKFITGLIVNYEIDKIAVSQFLLLGYMLGKRTLFNNIIHLRPASILYIRDFNLEQKTLHQFNFDYRTNDGKSFEENVNRLASLFSDAAVNRVNNSKKNIVTLSGGLDSRMVAACFFKNQIPFEIATILYKNGYAHEEVEIARELSKIFDKTIKILDIDPPRGIDLYELVRVKEGMNSLATSAILPFYRKVIDHFGREINFITGDNGDKLIFTVDRPIKKFKSKDSLAEYIADEHSVISIHKVCAMLKVSEDEIKADLIKVLESFPEDDLSQKYLHFRIIEKPFKYAFQGEDRHRNYFWHFTPFWSIHFFDYIMNCSDRSKKMHRIFGRIIGKYSEEALNIKYTNFRSSIFSFKGKAFMNLVYYIYPLIPVKFKEKLKSRFFGGNPKMEENSIIFTCIQEALKNTRNTGLFNMDTSILAGLRKYALFNILTLVSSEEYFYQKEISLQKYFNNEFN